MLLSVEMPLEGVEVFRPQAAIGCQPRIERFERFGFDLVDPLLCFGSRRHESGLAQHFEVLGNSGLRNIEHGDELADAPLTSLEVTEDTKASGFTKYGEVVRDHDAICV